jgi:hypothetical protein
MAGGLRLLAAVDQDGFQHAGGDGARFVRDARGIDAGPARVDIADLDPGRDVDPVRDQAAHQPGDRRRHRRRAHDAQHLAGDHDVTDAGLRAERARGRRKQVLEAVRAAADELSNTPAICRKSYVHDTIVTAFEDGILERFAATMKGYRSQSKREALLAQVVMAAAA